MPVEPLGAAGLKGVDPGERVLLRAAFDDASVRAFRTADAIAAVLVASGGLIAFAGIRNPRRRGFVDRAVETPSRQVAP